MKKLIAIVLSGVLACSLLFSVAAIPEKVSVGFGADTAGLNDHYLNQAVNAGCLKAKNTLGVEYNALEAKTDADVVPNFQKLIDDGSNLILANGFTAAAVTTAAKKNKAIKFVMIDSTVRLSNVQSMTFKSQEAAFLVGIIAGKTTKTNKIGFIGGLDITVINAFEYGFYAGVKSVNPLAAENLINRKNVRFIDTFTDSSKCYSAAKQLYSSGCDIVFHAAGASGIGLFKAAKELKTGSKEPIWAIGVDFDQAVTESTYSDVILTSALKSEDVAAFLAIKAFASGSFKGGKTVELGLKEGGVDIAASSSQHTSADALAAVAKYKKAIIEKKIVVPLNKKGALKFKPKNME